MTITVTIPIVCPHDACGQEYEASVTVHLDHLAEQNWPPPTTNRICPHCGKQARVQAWLDCIVRTEETPR